MAIASDNKKNALRFISPHRHLNHTFGNNWFALKAESFARFFGTPTFLLAQTLIVFIWVLLNAVGWVKFDPYPFILLNLAFSVQSAYSAPLILLAQTRQSERDAAHAQADAEHREALASINTQYQINNQQTQAIIVNLLNENTQLTSMTKALVERIETLTLEIKQKHHD